MVECLPNICNNQNSDLWRCFYSLTNWTDFYSLLRLVWAIVSVGLCIHCSFCNYEGHRCTLARCYFCYSSKNNVLILSATSNVMTSSLSMHLYLRTYLMHRYICSCPERNICHWILSKLYLITYIFINMWLK